jgi:hypothetical protein
MYVRTKCHFIKCIVACRVVAINDSEISKYTRAVSRLRLGKHVPVATDTHVTIEGFLETVFTTRSVKRGYKEEYLSKNSSVGREPPFRKDLSVEAEESPLLEAVTRERLMKTQQAVKDL